MDSYSKALLKMSSLIKNKEALKEIKEIEEQIFSDKEIIPFIVAFNKAQDDFNFVLSHFKDDEEKVEEAKRKLVSAKKEMDNIPLIKKYNALYEEISSETLYLENNLKKILANGENKSC